MGENAILEKKSRVGAIDGLRLWAITLVIMSHTGLFGQGGVGNDIFFAISGFLAMMPFKNNSEDAFKSPKYWISYYVGKIVRIVPVYWISIVVVYFLMPGDFFQRTDFNASNNVFLNMSFINCMGHFWFLQQIMVFYLIMPVLMLLILLIKFIIKKFTTNECVIDFVFAGVFLILSILSQKFLTQEVFSLRSNNANYWFRLSLIMVGVMGGYLARAIKRIEINEKVSKILSVISSIYIIICLALTILTSSQILSKFDEKYATYYIGWEHPYLLAVLTVIALIMIVVFPDSVVNKVMGNKILAELGACGFCMYIIHWFFINRLGTGIPVRTFLSVYIVTIAVALLLHRGIEDPSIKFGKMISAKINKSGEKQNEFKAKENS